MFKNSTIWRSIHAAWELTCDLPMIAPLRPDAVDKKLDKHSFDEFNPLYFMPVLGAAAGILALIAGRVFSYLLPVNGSSILFALVVTFAGELRTSGRALALNVTFFENNLEFTFDVVISISLFSIFKSILKANKIVNDKEGLNERV